MAEDFASADLEELKQLLSTAKRPRVQGFIRSQIDILEKQSQGAASEEPLETKELLSHEVADPGAAAPSPNENAVLEAVPAEGREPKVQPLNKITKAAEPYYVTLSSFGWDQETDRVNIYISLEGASKEKTVIDVRPESFEVKVHDVKGKNYRCGVAKLHKSVNPDTAVITVKPKRIVLTLRKVEKGVSWPDLQFKEDKFKKPPSDEKDPMAGIMDLMKNMYDEGDDEMKRTIAKAWSESRSGKKPTADML